DIGLSRRSGLLREIGCGRDERQQNGKTEDAKCHATSPDRSCYPSTRSARSRQAVGYAQAMAVIVQKYGGSSVADVDKLRRVAERVMRTRVQGHNVVVVVSAMGDTTEVLLAMA